MHSLTMLSYLSTYLRLYRMPVLIQDGLKPSHYDNSTIRSFKIKLLNHRI
nr:MAG TPA: hypothetical protein [Caudoviricetes sp.]